MEDYALSRSRRALLLVVLGVCAAVGLGGFFVLAERLSYAQTACENRYSAGSRVPAGYGAAWRMFGDARELLLAGECSGESINIRAGAADEDVYVYARGYYYTGTTWQRFAFSSGNGARKGSWIRGRAHATVPTRGTTLHVAAYVCERQSGEWRCGCRDRACTTPRWQVQTIERRDARSASAPEESAQRAVNQCLAGNLAERLGTNRLLIGVEPGERSVLREARYDITYQYLVGIPAQSEPMSSDARCPVRGEGGTWWGCWQDVEERPGEYVRHYVERAEADGHLPYFTYYVLVYAAGNREGEPVLELIQDENAMERYFDDWRFALEQIGDAEALLHIEPDFWGFAQLHEGDDPHAIPAAVASANARDCASHENSVAGLGRCMVSMVRDYAPNALVGLHASSWGTGRAAHSDAGIDVAREARLVGDFIRASAPDADFVVVEASDHDAATENSWWDDDNQQLPHFARAFAWTRLMAETADKPVVWWQVPVGNEQLPNEPRRYQDNRVAYFFDHPDEVAATHAVAMLFGAGSPNMTTPATDGGYLNERARAYQREGGESLCS